MLAIVSPGQGAQTPGFVTPWLEDPGFADHYAWLSAVSAIDLLHFGTKGDADEIRDTKIAQPLLVAAGLAAGRQLLGDGPLDGAGVGVVAGHSVGEITAAALGGALSVEQAMVLVRERGLGMAEAAAAEQTSMTAVLGGVRDEVLAAIERHGLTPANDNGPGQIVAAGAVGRLEAFAADPPARARLAPLSVAGAFHTHFMSPAVARLEAVGRGVTTRPASVPVVSNRDGARITDGRDILQRIVSQTANPVRWDLCLEAFGDLGVTGVLELPPAGTLTGIIKRNLKDVETFALKTPDQLDDARAFVERHRLTADRPAGES